MCILSKKKKFKKKYKYQKYNDNRKVNKTKNNLRQNDIIIPAQCQTSQSRTA